MIVDRIASIDNERITTQKGFVITKKLAESQFFPVPIESAWLTDMGFEKHCKDEIFSIWEQTLFDAKENKPITIIIIEHNENKLFFLGLHEMNHSMHILYKTYFVISQEEDWIYL